MAHNINTLAAGNLGGLPIHDLLPERPALIGEFSLAYEAFREATIADLAPVTKYEYLQALQLADLNWAILQAKASADVELSTGTERRSGSAQCETRGRRRAEYRRQLLHSRRPAAMRMTSRTPLTGMPLRRKL